MYDTSSSVCVAALRSCRPPPLSTHVVVEYNVKAARARSRSSRVQSLGSLYIWQMVNGSRRTHFHTPMARYRVRYPELLGALRKIPPGVSITMIMVSKNRAPHILWIGS